MKRTKILAGILARRAASQGSVIPPATKSKAATKMLARILAACRAATLQELETRREADLLRRPEDAAVDQLVGTRITIDVLNGITKGDMTFFQAVSAAVRLTRKSVRFHPPVFGFDASAKGTGLSRL